MQNKKTPDERPASKLGDYAAATVTGLAHLGTALRVEAGTEALAAAAKATAAATEPACTRLSTATKQVPELVARVDAALAVALHALESVGGGRSGSGRSRQGTTAR